MDRSQAEKQSAESDAGPKRFYVILFCFYLISVVPYPLERLTSIDLYRDSSLFSDFVFVLQVMLLVYFSSLRAKVVRDGMAHSSAKPFSNRSWMKLYAAIPLMVLIGYLWNGFVVKYFFRETVNFVFFLSLLHTLATLIHFDARHNWFRIRRMAKSILLLHLLGIFYFTAANFDSGIILDRLYRDPLTTGKSGVWDRVYFFALAGNEEAYTILIFLLIGIIGLRRRMQTAILLFSTVFFLYLGTRATFFLFLILLFIWGFAMYSSVRARIVLTLVPLILVLGFREKILFYVTSAFQFINNLGDLLKFSSFLDQDNLAFRIEILWKPVLDKLFSGWVFFTGISVNGLNHFTTDVYDDYSALHNTFLYFFAAAGIVGLFVYVKGYLLMLRAYRKTRSIPQDVPQDHLVNFLLAVVSMFVYALINNAYSTQGMITYILLIAVGLCFQSSQAHIPQVLRIEG